MLLTTLAAINTVDTVALGLDGLGRPEGFLGRAVEGWLKRGAAADAGLVLDELGAWLRTNAVPDRAPGLLHNDFKLDNVIVDPVSLAPNAVVDWDQGTRGDPIFDLATLLSYWVQPGDPPVMHEMQQMPTAGDGFITREAAALRWGRTHRARRVGHPVSPGAGDGEAERHLPTVAPAVSAGCDGGRAVCAVRRSGAGIAGVRGGDRGRAGVLAGRLLRATGWGWADLAVGWHPGSARWISRFQPSWQNCKSGRGCSSGKRSSRLSATCGRRRMGRTMGFAGR